MPLTHVAWPCLENATRLLLTVLVLGGVGWWGSLPEPRTENGPGGRVRPPPPRTHFGSNGEGGEGPPPPLPLLPRTGIRQPGRVPRDPPPPYHGQEWQVDDPPVASDDETEDLFLLFESIRQADSLPQASPFSILGRGDRMCDVITHTHTAPHHMMHNEVPYHSFDTLCLSLPFSV